MNYTGRLSQASLKLTEFCGVQGVVPMTKPLGDSQMQVTRAIATLGKLFTDRPKLTDLSLPRVRTGYPVVSCHINESPNGMVSPTMSRHMGVRPTTPAIQGAQCSTTEKRVYNQRSELTSTLRTGLLKEQSELLKVSYGTNEIRSCESQMSSPSPSDSLPPQRAELLEDSNGIDMIPALSDLLDANPEHKSAQLPVTIDYKLAPSEVSVLVQNHLAAKHSVIVTTESGGGIRIVIATSEWLTVTQQRKVNNDIMAAVIAKGVVVPKLVFELLRESST